SESRYRCRRCPGLGTLTAPRGYQRESGQVRLISDKAKCVASLVSTNPNCNIPTSVSLVDVASSSNPVVRDGVFSTSQVLLAEIPRGPAIAGNSYPTFSVVPYTPRR